jgi:N-acetylmuramoyl-L-alanine amidase
MRIGISSGHGLYVRGASGLIDEVDEARRMLPVVADGLRVNGHLVETFNDDVSTTQEENLSRIVDWHNSTPSDLAVSIHFNAYIPTADGRGTEVLYLTQSMLAADVASAISSAGRLINRGAHKRTDLYFLNHTEAPAILIEVCFVDSSTDVKAYQTHFNRICEAIADVGSDTPPAVARFTGKCSSFGGPADLGVDPDEGLAFIYDVDMAPRLFLVEQPPGTTGLARRLDPDVNYVACRWDYIVTPKSMLADQTIKAAVCNLRTGSCLVASPADWGPHEDTGRAADLSPGLMERLGMETDDEVEVIYPVDETVA